MNNKLIISVILIILLAIGGYFFLNPNSKTNETSINQASLTTPGRPAEINGIVRSVEGNVLILSNEINREILTEEEKDAKKAALQTLAQEERQALKQQELENVETKDIEIIIPIGITIIKSSGNLTGESLPANLSDIQKDTYISAWLNEDNVIEFVKIKGTN